MMVIRSFLGIFAVTALLLLSAGPAAASCPTGCDDGNPCTDDICDPTLGCVHSNNTLPCTDGNACTTNDACNGGVCVGGDRATTGSCTACSSVANLPGAGAVVRGKTSGAGNLSSGCATSQFSGERVFKWTPVTSGVASFKTCGPKTNFDSVLYVRKDACSNGAEQTCNDDGPCSSSRNGAEASQTTLNVTAGTDYYIVVDGYGSPGSTGDFELAVNGPTVCGNNVREGVEECDGNDHTACTTGQCTSSCTCVTPATGLSDLGVEITDWFFDFDATVDPGDVAEGCAEALTGVDLLRLGVLSRNYGTADFFIGATGCPAPCIDHPLEVCGNPSFICSPAAGHNHGHYTDFARYELLDAANQTVVVGHKQGFCLKDGFDAGPCPAYHYDCNYQGISAGCADLYESGLGCQYLDITGVPAGNYTLRALIDPFDRITELTKTNNIAAVAVTIPPHACSNPTPIPPGGGTFSGTTAGVSNLKGSCGNLTSLSPEKVFSWTPTASGPATIDTCDVAGTNFNTVLYVRSGVCHGGSELVCKDDTYVGCDTANGGVGSRVTLNVTQGTTYFLVVDGYAGQSGNFKLHVAGPTPPTACSNGSDDDGDGQIDFPQDTGCKSSADPSERIECADGLDNDGDGKIDTADDGCANAQDDSELPECADGVDNDGDGLTDFPADPGCASNQPFAIERPECSDSLDNDGDGKTDFPADSTCTMASGQRESGLACGLLGIEALIPVVVTLMARRRRAAAARRNS
jgi:hypothetical protein